MNSTTKTVSVSALAAPSHGIRASSNACSDITQPTAMNATRQMIQTLHYETDVLCLLRVAVLIAAYFVFLNRAGTAEKWNRSAYTISTRGAKAFICKNAKDLFHSPSRQSDQQELPDSSSLWGRNQTHRRPRSALLPDQEALLAS